MFEKPLKLLAVNLSLFNDGEASTPAGDESGSNGGFATPQTANYTSSRNPLSNVQYGVADDGEQSLDAQGADVQTQEIDRRAQFERFKSEYKDLYGSEVESIIKSRFKKYNSLEQQLSNYDPIIQSLMEVHGAKDIDELRNIVEDMTYERLADEEGLTTEQARRLKQAERENKQLKSVFHEQEQQKVINETIAEWNRQADALKQTYSDFDFNQWTTNKQFMDLLGAGIDVKTAYEIVDLPNIKAGTARQAERNVVANIQAKGRKIPENGVNGTPGMVVKASVKDLSKADREEIARRAMRGETIKF